jgi:hypothetical protein
MAEKTNAWEFNIPEQGETDSAEVYRANIEAIDAALLDGEQRAAVAGFVAEGGLLGQLDGSDGEEGDAYDAIHTAPSRIPPKVTKSHYHHAPQRVPSADRADFAASAATAAALSPALKVNGAPVGDSNDISVVRVAWGTLPPATGWAAFGMSAPNRGDLYIQTLS